MPRRKNDLPIITRLSNSSNFRSKDVDGSTHWGSVRQSHVIVRAGGNQLIVPCVPIAEIDKSDSTIACCEKISFWPRTLRARISDNGIIGGCIRTPALIERSQRLR